MHIVVSIDHLKTKLSKAQFLLYLKEEFFLLILGSHRHGSFFFNDIHDLFMIDLKSLNFKTVIHICRKIIIQPFKIT